MKTALPRPGDIGTFVLEAGLVGVHDMFHHAALHTGWFAVNRDAAGTLLHEGDYRD